MSDADNPPEIGAVTGQDIPDLSRTAACRGRLRRLEDRVFTERRLRFYGTGVVVGLIITVILCWARPLGHWLIGPGGKLGSIDFCWIWASGKFAVSSHPASIYDDATFAAAQSELFYPNRCSFIAHFDYPPTLLLTTWALGFMPYVAAYAVWTVATFLVYESAVFSVIPRAAAPIAAIASPASLKNIQLGHNGFLTAGLIGMSLVLLERRPWLSGVFLGLLTYKPQFGVLFPLALLASRNWRALAGATAATLVLGAVTAVAFGYRTWPSFLFSLSGRNASLSPDKQIELWLESVYGLLHWAGAGARLAWTVHLLAAVGAASAVCAVWAKPIPHALKAATLCIAAVLVSPYALPYDLCILSIAAAFLIKDGSARGFLAGERTIVLICAVLLYCPLAPLGPVVCAVLLWLVLQRIVRAPVFPCLPLDRAAGFSENFSETTAFAGN
jgi:hypothetical protein